MAAFLRPNIKEGWRLCGVLLCFCFKVLTLWIHISCQSFYVSERQAAFQIGHQ